MDNGKQVKLGLMTSTEKMFELLSIRWTHTLSASTNASHTARPTSRDISQLGPDPSLKKDTNKAYLQQGRKLNAKQQPSDVNNIIKVNGKIKVCIRAHRPIRPPNGMLVHRKGTPCILNYQCPSTPGWRGNGKIKVCIRAHRPTRLVPISAGFRSM